MPRKNYNPNQNQFDFTQNEVKYIVELRPGSLAIQGEIAGLMSEMLRKCPLSRYQVAAQVSELVGYEVAVSTLYNYTAESHKNMRIPVDIFIAVSVVCKNNGAIDAVCRHAGGRFIYGEDMDYMELAMVQKELMKLEQRKKDLQARLVDNR